MTLLLFCNSDTTITLDGSKTNLFFRFNIYILLDKQIISIVC